MPRKARKYLGTNYLHVMAQGVERKFIFNTDRLKQYYKETLKKNLESTNITILSYCIMSNHVHLELFGDSINEISKLMQKTNTSFANYYNKINNRVGPVFRGRFLSQPIFSQKQLFNCLVYIHYNPLAANMVQSLADYKYSSYLEYIKHKDLITDESIKLLFGSSENYIDLFNELHKKNKIEDIADVIENYKSSEIIIKDFLFKTNKNIHEVKADKKLFSDLLIDLRKYGGISLRNMSKIFNINKDRLGNLIKSREIEKDVDSRT